MLVTLNLARIKVLVLLPYYFSFSMDGDWLQLRGKTEQADWLLAHTRFSLHSPSSSSFSSPFSSSSSPPFSSSFFPITVHHSNRQSASAPPPPPPPTSLTPSPSSDSSSTSSQVFPYPSNVLPRPSSPDAPALAILQCSPQNSPPRVVLLAKGKKKSVRP